MEDAPAFHTVGLSEREAPILKHFSTKYILYAGSSEGCGCGFRHRLLDGEKWFPVMTDPDEDDQEIKKNMQQLWEYVAEILDKRNKVELYACWEDEFDKFPLSKENITRDSLISEDFCLKERGFYVVE